VSSDLVSGRGHPRDWDQFLDWFAHEESRLSYLEQPRWPEGFVCPRCDARDPPYRSSRGRLICPACRHQCTVTAGTLFCKTRTPASRWPSSAPWLRLPRCSFGPAAGEQAGLVGFGRGENPARRSPAPAGRSAFNTPKSFGSNAGCSRSGATSKAQSRATSPRSTERASSRRSPGSCALRPASFDCGRARVSATKRSIG